MINIQYCPWKKLIIKVEIFHVKKNDESCMKLSIFTIQIRVHIMLFSV